MIKIIVSSVVLHRFFAGKDLEAIKIITIDPEECGLFFGVDLLYCEFRNYSNCKEFPFAPGRWKKLTEFIKGHVSDQPITIEITEAGYMEVEIYKASF